MKKILSLLLVGMFSLTLCACGNDTTTSQSEKEETKKPEVTTASCSMSDEEMTTVIDLSATDDEVDKVKMSVTPSNESMGIDSFEELDAETKEQIKVIMIESLGLDPEKEYKGIKVTVDFDKEMTVNVVADLKTADPEVLKTIGLDFEDADMSLKTSIKDLEDEGLTCK